MTGLSKPVVVGVDGSTSATHAVHWAAEEAARRNTGLVIMHACMVVPVHAPYVAGSSEAYAEAVFDHGRQMLAEAVTMAKEEGLGSTLTVTVRRPSGRSSNNNLGSE